MIAATTKDAGASRLPRSISGDDWCPKWNGRKVCIMGSGPSLTIGQVNEIRQARDAGVKVIAINRNFELAPWADVLFCSDDIFWDVTPDAHKFQGLKICSLPTPGVKYPDIRTVKRATAIKSDGRLVLGQGPSIIGSGNNSGFQAINLAANWGGGPIVLVGFDGTIENGTHWHGDHEGGLGNPDENSMEIARRFYAVAAEQAKQAGLRIINASAFTRIEGFERMELKDALAL